MVSASFSSCSNEASRLFELQFRFRLDEAANLDGGDLAILRARLFDRLVDRRAHARFGIGDLLVGIAQRLLERGRARALDGLRALLGGGGDELVRHRADVLLDARP